MKRKFKILILTLFFLCLSSPVLAQEENIDLVNEIKDILLNHYIEPLPYNFLDQNTVSDLLETLRDPYTKYYDPKEFGSFLLSLDGKFGGVGLTIEKKGAKVIVTNVLPRTPAAKVDIQKGDFITHIDHHDLGKLDMEAITDLFRGEPGTYIRLKTFRPRTATYYTYILARKIIEIEPLESTILARNIGYIKILDFNQEAAQEFPKHLKRLKEKKIKGLILDLRDNPGGLIGSALDISRELLPPGSFVKLLYKGRKPEMISTIGTNNLLPLIVLVNKETASAAEILAGAIQDRQAGILVGTTTYGKATIQSIVPLVNGGALKFTSGKYLTPNGRQINKLGLKPDFYIFDPQYQILESIWMLEHQVQKSLIFQLSNKNYLSKGISKTCAVKPYLSRGHFMAPLREIIESLGGKVNFISPENIQVNFKKNNITIKINSRVFYHDGEKDFFPTKPILKNHHTLVPIRAIAELLGAKVEWRPLTGQVIIFQ